MSCNLDGCLLNVKRYHKIWIVYIYISQEHIVKKYIFVTIPLNPAALMSYKVRTNVLTMSIKTGIYHVL